MNAQTSLKPGDIVYFQYGVMCGDDFGTYIGSEPTPWGMNHWVRNSDFTLTPVHSFTGTVSAKLVTNCQGEQYLSARGATKIGAYRVALESI